MTFLTIDRIRVVRDQPELNRIMQQLGIDELQARRHLEQLHALRARLRQQQTEAVQRCVDSWAASK